jgi:hypothetical protein
MKLGEEEEEVLVQREGERSFLKEAAIFRGLVHVQIGEAGIFGSQDRRFHNE